MREKPTGVFVRLPLSDEQRMTANEAPYKKDRKGSALEASILSIGAPVTGGDIPVIGTIHIGENGNPFFTAPELHSLGGDVVRQSDAQAQIAALEAEVVRKGQRIAELEGELSGFHAGLSELIAKEVADLKGGAA